VPFRSPRLRTVALLLGFVGSHLAGAADLIFSSGFETPSDIPFPVATHPRLWITADDVPRLRTWATASNPIYADGITPLVADAEHAYENEFFPDGAPNPNYPDPGDVQGYFPFNTEQYALVLAFNALIDPEVAHRVREARYARNLLMHAMNLAALGHADGRPFRDSAFATGNRANATGEQWPLIVDWLYDAVDDTGARVLTDADRATIRNVFLQWSDDCLHASTTYGDHPEPIGVVDSRELLPNDKPYRMAANNYYLGHARLLTMMALAIDPVDDPPLDIEQPTTVLGNTLRSYIRDATGAWLYQEYAMFGDAGAVAGAYGIQSTDGFGLASGGLPPEGGVFERCAMRVEESSEWNAGSARGEFAMIPMYLT
jgi:hypothetical protein